MKKLLALVVSLTLFAGTSHALLVTFNLFDTGATAEIESGTITRDGVTATLTPIVLGSTAALSTGVLNQTASGGFGINAEGSGDDTVQIDGDAGVESVSINFNTDILFTQLDLFELGSSDEGSLKINGFDPLSFSDNGTEDVHGYSINNLVLTGQTVLLSFVSGNGFGFEGFTIDTEVPTTGSPASVPESGTTLSFLGLGVFGLILFRRLRC